MKRIALPLVLTFIGLTIGNFIYQAVIGRGDFPVATERSVFQGFALLAAYLSIKRSAQ
jgi:hypothetical protein